MFGHFRLVAALKQNSGLLCLLPNGLYSLDNRCLPASRKLAARLETGRRIGVLLAVRTSQVRWIEPVPDSAFEEQPGQPCPPFGAVDTSHLCVEDVAEWIGGFAWRADKLPYENLLEAAIIRSFIDGLNLGLALKGGVWISRAPKPAVQKAVEFHEKSRLIAELRKKLAGYPLALVEVTNRLGVRGYYPGHTARAAALEYTWLQIQSKNILQDICLGAACFSADDKQKYDRALTDTKKLLQTYPAVPPRSIS